MPDGVVVAVLHQTNSPPVEGCQAPPDGVVVGFLHQPIPLLWRGVRASPDGVVVEVLHQPIPLLWRGVRLRLTGWLWGFCTSQFPRPQSWFCRPNGLYYQTFSVALHTYYEPQSTVRTKTGGGFDVESKIESIESSWYKKCRPWIIKNRTYSLIRAGLIGIVLAIVIYWGFCLLKT